jgi:hypothetical protein
MGVEHQIKELNNQQKLHLISTSCAIFNDLKTTKKNQNFCSEAIRRNFFEFRKY